MPRTVGFASTPQRLQGLDWSPKLRGRDILNVIGLPFRALWPSSRTRLASSIRSHQSGSQPETGAARAGSMLALTASSLPCVADTADSLNRDIKRFLANSSGEPTLQPLGQPCQSLPAFICRVQGREAVLLGLAQISWGYDNSICDEGGVAASLGPPLRRVIFRLFGSNWGCPAPVGCGPLRAGPRFFSARLLGPAG